MQMIGMSLQSRPVWSCLQVHWVALFLIHALAGTHAVASVSAVVGPTVPSTVASCCSGMMSPLLLFFPPLCRRSLPVPGGLFLFPHTRKVFLSLEPDLLHSPCQKCSVHGASLGLASGGRIFWHRGMYIVQCKMSHSRDLRTFPSLWMSKGLLPGTRKVFPHEGMLKKKLFGCRERCSCFVFLFWQQAF